MLMKRRGFGLITAIVLLVLIATVGTMILSIATTSSKKATDDFQRIQAEMLARSATEFAVMRVQGFNRTAATGCLENIDINAAPFDISVTINYLFNGNKPANCADTNVWASNDIAPVNHQPQVEDKDLSGTVILDVVVTEQMPVDQAMWNKEPIRIHKRTIQKP